MGDLDNFFAKKDKKKVKGRKFDNLDDIAKRLHESEKKLEKELIKIEPAKKTLDEVLSTTASSGKENAKQEQKSEKEEEEWNDFQDDSQKDLSNLKISRLQIEDDDDGVGGYGSGDEEGGNRSENNEGSSVWKKTVEEPVASIIYPVKEERTRSSYVPPQLRNAQPSSMPKGGSSRPKVAPDITSTMAFPSLADAQTGTLPGPWGRKKDDARLKGFDEVRHGSGRPQVANYAPPKLSTANRFDCLTDDHS